MTLNQNRKFWSFLEAASYVCNWNWIQKLKIAEKIVLKNFLDEKALEIFCHPNQLQSITK